MPRLTKPGLARPYQSLTICGTATNPEGSLPCRASPDIAPPSPTRHRQAMPDLYFSPSIDSSVNLPNFGL